MLELGITFSYTQLLIDAEIARMIRRAITGIPVNEETLAVEVIKAVGAGKNYLTQKHTVSLMAREQSRARLIDRRMRDAWMRRGGTDMAKRASEEAISILSTHKPSPVEPEALAKFRDIIAEAEND